MKSRNSRSKVKFHVLVLVFILGLLVLFKLNQQQHNEHLYSKTFSDGWNNCTFKYPDNATIKYALGAPKKITIRVDETTQCHLAVGTIKSTEVNTYSNNAKDIIINGMTWIKNKGISAPNHWLYRFEWVNWEIIRDGRFYLFDSGQESERFCESIIKTFYFGIDPTSNSAKKAQKAKAKSIEYVYGKYPEKVFRDGIFIYDKEEKNMTEIFDSTEYARVTFSDTDNFDFIHSIGILLQEHEDEWKVIGEVDPW